MARTPSTGEAVPRGTRGILGGTCSNSVSPQGLLEPPDPLAMCILCVQLGKPSTRTEKKGSHPKNSPQPWSCWSSSAVSPPPNPFVLLKISSVDPELADVLPDKSPALTDTAAGVHPAGGQENFLRILLVAVQSLWSPLYIHTYIYIHIYIYICFELVA